MKEKLIKLAKDKGFKSQVIGKSVESKYSCKKELFYYLWMCELRKWLTEKYNYFLTQKTNFDNNFYSEGRNIEGKDYSETFNEISTYCYKTYEEALEKGLYEALKLI